MRSESLGRTVPARVMRARVGSSVIYDAREVAAVAIACVPYMPALWDRRDAARNAHDFAQQAVKYVEEEGDQYIRTPWRTVKDGHGDCKSTAILIADLCAGCGCSVVMRFIYHPGEDDFGHVYPVVDGVPVDHLLAFSEEMPYTWAEDVTIHD